MGIIKETFIADRIKELLFLWSNDKYTQYLEEKLNVSILFRGGTLFIQGDETKVGSAVSCFNKIERMLSMGYCVTGDRFKQFVEMIGDRDVAPVTIRGKQLFPKTKNQAAYIDEIRQHSIVIGAGPSGTGKTYLAVAMAVEALLSSSVKRIILTRPAVEAGESLGFLPGDLTEKINPYLRPLYDALFDMIGPANVERYIENGKIEIATLAYMRGRTLNNSFAILDEAQNSSMTQMKMFLTRFGFGSKMVITGDTTQVDLPDAKKSGLLIATKILKDIDDIKIIYFDSMDVVRNPLVSKIIDAYEASRKF